MIKGHNMNAGPKEIRGKVISATLKTVPLAERGPGYPVTLVVEVSGALWRSFDLATAQIYFQGVEQHPAGLFAALTSNETEEITIVLHYNADGILKVAALTRSGEKK